MHAQRLLLLVRLGRKSGRSGFTLVELLVVIGIIAILAGVALGPITRGLRQAQQNAGVQTSRTIAISEFQYAGDNSQNYPDASGGDASNVAKLLLAGNYISDPGIFYIGGSGETKYTGTTASTSIAATNISWDFAGTGGTGLNSNVPDLIPVVWSSTAGDGNSTSAKLAATGPMAVTLAATNPFGTAGIAVTYKSNSAKFVIQPLGAPNLTDVTYPGYASASILPGGG